MIVNAIDDVPRICKLIEVVQEYFPDLRIIARARNVTHWRELRARGVGGIERETFEVGTGVGRHTLEALGVRPHEARERADVFRRYNLSTMEALLPHWADEAQRISSVRASRAEFEQQFQKDQEEFEQQVGHGWQRTDVE